MGRDDDRLVTCCVYAGLLNEKPLLGAHGAFLDKPVSVTGLREAVSLLLFGHARTCVAVVAPG